MSLLQVKRSDAFLCGVGLNLKSAFLQSWMWFSGGGRSLEHLGMWWHFSAASVRGKELGVREAPAEDESRVSWDQRGCSKQPEEKLGLRLKQEDAFYHVAREN